MARECVGGIPQIGETSKRMYHRNPGTPKSSPPRPSVRVLTGSPAPPFLSLSLSSLAFFCPSIRAISRIFFFVSGGPARSRDVENTVRLEDTVVVLIAITRRVVINFRKRVTQPREEILIAIRDRIHETRARISLVRILEITLSVLSRPKNGGADGANLTHCFLEIVHPPGRGIHATYIITQRAEN